jgi:hypothetical protein
MKLTDKIETVEPVPGSTTGKLQKASTTVKAAVMEAFKDLGGSSFLVQLAQDDPRAFAGLLAKMLPSEINAEVSVTHTIDIKATLEAARARVSNDSSQAMVSHDAPHNVIDGDYESLSTVHAQSNREPGKL